jgi:O-antigen/teichoic acid export membrane protein
MQLLQDVFYRVFITEVARRDQMRYSRILGGLWLLGIFAGIGIVLIGPPVAHWVYGGRYDQAMNLLPWLALAAVLKLGETFPRSHLIGAASMPMIRRYTLMTLLTAVISIGLGLGLTILHGLLGTVIAGSVIFAMRNLINYGFMTLILRERRQSTV